MEYAREFDRPVDFVAAVVVTATLFVLPLVGSLLALFTAPANRRANRVT